MKAIVMGVACFIPCAVHANPAFTVEGTVHAFERLSGTEQNFQYSMSVRDCQWGATLTWDDNRVEAFSDGNEVYKLMTGSFYGATPVAAVKTARVPVDLPHPVLPTLWTAFASACWFNKETTAVFPPEAAKEMPTRCSIQRMSEPPRLPQSVVYWDTGGDGQGGKRPKPFDRGFKKGEYLVLSKTNVAGLAIPARFTLLGFEPKENSESTNDLVMTCRIEGIVTNLSGGGADKLAPPRLSPLREVMVLDFRFAVTPIRYVTNRWLSRAEARQRPEYQRLKERFGVIDPRMRHSITIYFVLTVLLAGVFTVVIRRRGKSKGTAP